MTPWSLIHRWLGDDHEDELGAVLIAIDNRRSVFNLVRDEGNGRGDVSRTAVAMDSHLLANVEAAHRGLRYEESNFNIFRRQKLDDGASGVDPFACAIERVE